ncbi:MAG: hypothetical protein VKP62_01490 [Candidatus Sericytochromatia bacterium]|nr:hypothetical protein [Candidatus Sericytochromatia bacterium]
MTPLTWPSANVRVAWSRWLDRLLWGAVLAVLLVRCVLPTAPEPLPPRLQALRFGPQSAPTLLVFDGSR